MSSKDKIFVLGLIVGAYYGAVAAVVIRKLRAQRALRAEREAEPAPHDPEQHLLHY